jgi:acyl dehydratase
MPGYPNRFQPSTAPHGPNARHFEDFTVGEAFTTQGRTLTATDGALWSMFTGDMNPIHVDASFAAEHSIFGETVPQGLLTVAVASGLWERLGLFNGTGQAMLAQTLLYRSAARIGDTVRSTLRVSELVDTLRVSAAEVRFALDIRAVERDVLLVDGTMHILCARRTPLQRHTQ